MMYRPRLGLLLTKSFDKCIIRFLSNSPVAFKIPVENSRAVIPFAALSKFKLQTITTPDVRQSNSTINQNLHDFENEYIFKYIHCPLYDRYSNINKKVFNLPANQSIEKLRILLKCENKNEEHISNIYLEIRSQILYMNQLELTSLLSAIKDDQDKTFKDIVKLIDIELRWLLKKHVKTRLMDLDLWLYIADLFYECRVKSKFTHVLVNYLTSETDIELSNRQLLHLLFLIVLRRYQDKVLAKYEMRLCKSLNRASFEDLAIICMAYFKTKTRIENAEMLRQIIDLTTENLSSIDPSQPGYCSIIKCIRYSRIYQCRDSVVHMVLSLSEDLNRRIIFASPYNLVHTIKLMESFRIYDPKLLIMLKNAIFDNLNDFRIKDIQYSLTSLSNFAFMDLKTDTSLKQNFKKLVDNIVQEKRKDSEYQYYHLVPIIRALTMFGYYNNDLIAYLNNAIIDQNKFNDMKNVLEFEKSLLLAYISTHIDDAKVKITNIHVLREICAKIDRSPSTGLVKKNSSLVHLDNLLRGSHRKNSTNSTLFQSIASSLASTNDLRDPRYKFYYQYTFPHQNYYDLIITKSEREVGSFCPYTLLPKKVSSKERHCIIYATQKTDFVDGDQRLSGYKQTLIRLAKKLGYYVFPIDLHNPDIQSVASQVKCTLDS